MTTKSRDELNIVLIAEDPFRIALLRDCMRKSGLQCTIRRIAPTRKACACLARRKPFNEAAAPQLTLVYVAACPADDFGLIKAVAFGRQRSKSTLVLLVDSTSETAITNGTLDGGRSTMFSPQSLETFLTKLAGPQQGAFLGALSTLYQYGPLLVREPRCFRETHSDQMSA